MPMLRLPWNAGLGAPGYRAQRPPIDEADVSAGTSPFEARESRSPGRSCRPSMGSLAEGAGLSVQEGDGLEAAPAVADQTR